ncbi:hypothetical protein FRB93_005712 [Tulasnella sp. JGI-2019a]|nr:hypothetical protein FRB93_005712 [Tulasnella sp. JGI-2019a]
MCGRDLNTIGRIIANQEKWVEYDIEAVPGPEDLMIQVNSTRRARIPSHIPRGQLRTNARPPLLAPAGPS